jgi:hypothetical protein
LLNEYLGLITQPVPGEELEELREALRTKVLQFLKSHNLLISVDPKRELELIKLTPIALGRCRGCGRQFTSMQAVEDDAELEMRTAFDNHSLYFISEIMGAANRDVNAVAGKLGYKSTAYLIARAFVLYLNFSSANRAEEQH